MVLLDISKFKKRGDSSAQTDLMSQPAAQPAPAQPPSQPVQPAAQPTAQPAAESAAQPASQSSGPAEQPKADAPRPLQGGEEIDKITSLILEQIREINTSVNNKIREIDQKILKISTEVSSFKKIENEYSEKLVNIEKNVEKFIGLYELVTNQFNPFMNKEGESPDSHAKVAPQIEEQTSRIADEPKTQRPSDPKPELPKNPKDDPPETRAPDAAPKAQEASPVSEPAKFPAPAPKIPEPVPTDSKTPSEHSPEVVEKHEPLVVEDAISSEKEEVKVRSHPPMDAQEFTDSLVKKLEEPGEETLEYVMPFDTNELSRSITEEIEKDLLKRFPALEKQMLQEVMKEVMDRKNSKKHHENGSRHEPDKHTLEHADHRLHRESSLQPANAPGGEHRQTQPGPARSDIVHIHKKKADSPFFMKNGMTLTSLEDLYHALKLSDDTVYHFHTDGRNDFVSWTLTFDTKAAEDIKGAKTKSQALSALEKHL